MRRSTLSWALSAFFLFLFLQRGRPPSRGSAAECWPDSADAFPLPPFAPNASKAAVLVETRWHTRLLPAVANVLLRLPADWRLLLFLSPGNAPRVRAHPFVARYLAAGKIAIEVIPAFPPQRHRYASYNALLTSADFWRRIRFSHALIFQTDSALCRASAYSADDFLTWDFIGAPYTTGTCGNGGLSLRSVPRTLDALQLLDPPGTGDPEDEWFCAAFSRLGYSLPPRDVALSFAAESLPLAPGTSPPFGVHMAHRYLLRDPDALRALYGACPEARALRSAACRDAACARDGRVLGLLNRTAVCGLWRVTRKGRWSGKRREECA
ncbi:hypothetical protein DFJ74DRAFT_132280 [Hyaloraphidium curvatum]|nr:hypothetical protein DFJ74DRAFT_132280 [Hyaloraphidium curvatum]